MLKALEALDQELKNPVELLIGGGGAMLLKYHFPISTLDIDALVLKGATHINDIMPEAERVAQKLDIPFDWLNGYFETFLYTLPPDYLSRVQMTFTGKRLKVVALGLEDLLILKCFAGREKDIPHARAIMKKKLDLDLVEKHIEKLVDKNIPKSKEALDFFDDLRSEVDS